MAQQVSERMRGASIRPRLMASTGGEGREIMAIGPNCWGRGGNGAEAFKIMKREAGSLGGRTITFYAVPKGAWIDEIGGCIQWKSANDPDKVGIVEIGNFKIREAR